MSWSINTMPGNLLARMRIESYNRVERLDMSECDFFKPPPRPSRRMGTESKTGSGVVAGGNGLRSCLMLWLRLLWSPSPPATSRPSEIVARLPKSGAEVGSKPARAFPSENRCCCCCTGSGAGGRAIAATALRVSGFDDKAASWRAISERVVLGASLLSTAVRNVPSSDRVRCTTLCPSRISSASASAMPSETAASRSSGTNSVRPLAVRVSFGLSNPEGGVGATCGGLPAGNAEAARGRTSIPPAAVVSAGCGAPRAEARRDATA